MSTLIDRPEKSLPIWEENGKFAESLPLSALALKFGMDLHQLKPFN